MTHGWEGKRVLLFAGRILRKKGVHLLLEAFFLLAPEMTDLLLVIAGDYNRAESGYLRYLYRLSRPVSDRIIFAGFVPPDQLYGYVTVDNLHLIANRNVTAENAIFRIPLRTTSPITLYKDITVRSCIIEGTTRSGYIWGENITLEDNLFIHHPVIATQSLRLQLVRGTTRVLSNTFQGSDTSLGAVVFEPNIVSWRSSGTIFVSGNQVTRFTQFVNFFPHLDGNTRLLVDNNTVDHQDRSGNSVIFFSRVDYSLMEQIMIRSNTFVNPHGTRLAVYFTRSGDGNFVPGNGQIQVHHNTFNFPNGYGNPATDTVDPQFPVGFNINAEPLGMTLAVFDLLGNFNV